MSSPKILKRAWAGIRPLWTLATRTIKWIGWKWVLHDLSRKDLMHPGLSLAVIGERECRP